MAESVSKGKQKGATSDKAKKPQKPLKKSSSPLVDGGEEKVEAEGGMEWDSEGWSTASKKIVS
jgi:hypothetical protein